VQEHSISEIFMSQFKASSVTGMLDATKANMERKTPWRNWTFTSGMLWKFWGLILLMLVYCFSDQAKHWSNRGTAMLFNSVMSWSTFRDIHDNFACEEYTEADPQYHPNNPEFNMVQKIHDDTNEAIREGVSSIALASTTFAAKVLASTK
jgi:hypothetical protein